MKIEYRLNLQSDTLEYHILVPGKNRPWHSTSCVYDSAKVCGAFCPLFSIVHHHEALNQVVIHIACGSIINYSIHGTIVKSGE